MPDSEKTFLGSPPPPPIPQNVCLPLKFPPPLLSTMKAETGEEEVGGGIQGRRESGKTK